MEFKEKIKKLRKNVGLTYEEVGKKVGVSASTILRYESGNIENIRRDKIKKLADALGTTPAYLMGWEDGDESTLDITLTSHEKKVITAYRERPNMQESVDILLGLKEDNKEKTYRMPMAAYGGNGVEHIETTKEDSDLTSEFIRNLATTKAKKINK